MEEPMSLPQAVAHVQGSIGIGLLFVSGLLGQQTFYHRSTPDGALSPATLSLTLDDAIRRGLKTNLGLLESEQASQTARAERIQALSVLLPQVTGRLAETDEQLNLKTRGLNIPSNPYVAIPTVAGPFSYTEAQVNVSARIVDWNARRNLKSARAHEEAARLSVLGSRDLVVQAVANAYLQIIADRSRVEAVKAQVDTDQAVYKRTADQKSSGTAAGIDVLRSEVQLKTEQQVLVAARSQFEKDKLALVNSGIGDEMVIGTILHALSQFDQHAV
jgi:outer membrane protein TolC